MLKSIIFSFGVISSFLFLGCASKEVFKPQSVVGSWKKSDDIKRIEASTLSAALVEGRKVQVGSSVTDVVMDESESLLGYSGGWIVSSTIDGNVTLYDDKNKKQEKFNLKRTVAAAAVNDDKLAVLFSNNEMALYSISTKSLILKEQGDSAVVVNSKIVAPFFRDGLVIFSTLDGKVVIIDTELKKKLRTVIVSGEKHFNNIIFFELIDGKIIAATGNKILSLSQKETRGSYDIRSVVSDSKNIYIATKQGEILSLSSDLVQNAKLKFPFAHFLGVIATDDKVYALEKTGYLIEMPKDLSNYAVYKANVKKDGSVYIEGKKFYSSNEVIYLD